MNLNWLRIAVAVLTAPLLSAAAQPARILIITGESDTQYHDWRLTTPFFQKLLALHGTL